MTRPRKELVSVTDTPYYHIVSRCVRRTFLCGYDIASKTNYEHRREWIVERIRLLSSVFAIDICAYAVMSNHYHLCVKIDPAQLESLTHKEIAERWCSLFKGPILLQKWRASETLTPAELSAVSDMLTVFRNRLASLSWFMKCLNEPIAKQANREDNCTGHFWESRYKSQALKSEEALLTCMAYVDLNPIRAQMATSPEQSNYTSIQERIAPQFDLPKAMHNQTKLGALREFNLPLKPLLSFSGNVTNEMQLGIPFHLADYLELVDQTGRIVRNDKRGVISNILPTIFDRLNIEPNSWMINSTIFEQVYQRQFNTA